MSDLWEPDWVVSPGEVLLEWIQENNIHLATLNSVGLNPERLRRIVRAEDPIDSDTALTLSAVTNIPRVFWLALEHNFREGLKAGKHWSGIDGPEPHTH